MAKLSAAGKKAKAESREWLNAMRPSEKKAPRKAAKSRKRLSLKSQATKKKTAKKNAKAPSERLAQAQPKKPTAATKKVTNKKVKAPSDLLTQAQAPRESSPLTAADIEKVVGKLLGEQQKKVSPSMSEDDLQKAMLQVMDQLSNANQSPNTQLGRQALESGAGNVPVARNPNLAVHPAQRPPTRRVPARPIEQPPAQRPPMRPIAQPVYRPLPGSAQAPQNPPPLLQQAPMTQQVGGGWNQLGVVGNPMQQQQQNQPRPVGRGVQKPIKNLWE